MSYKRVLSSRFRGVAGAIRWYARTKQEAAPRLGLATPKRLLRTAVKRNRVKRLIRESFRLGQNRLTNKDVMIVVRRPVEDERRFRSDLNRIWHQVSELQ